jgi:hypothetical protein
MNYVREWYKDSEFWQLDTLFNEHNILTWIRMLCSMFLPHMFSVLIFVLQYFDLIKLTFFSIYFYN